MFRLRHINFKNLQELYFSAVVKVAVTNSLLFPIIGINSYKDILLKKINNDPLYCINFVSGFSVCGALSGLLFPVALPVVAIHLYKNNGNFNIHFLNND